MTTFYLIRHAEAEGNLYRRMHGQLDSMVTPNGMKQIRALAERFADISVDACYTSDLIRTRTTAQAICVSKGLSAQAEPAFRELEVGEWEDLTFGYLNTFCPDQMDRFGKDPAHWQVEGSEPFSRYTKRFIEAMTKLGETHPGKTVAIFSHAAVMRGVIMTLFPGEKILPSDNTCVSKLEYQSGRYTLVFQNDNSHLTAEISTAARNRAMGAGGSRTDHLFWFREGASALPGLRVPETGIIFTVMAGDRPAGVLSLSEQDQDTGVLNYMGLLPHWRGRGRSVQLLGQAVFVFRRMQKNVLIFQKPADGSLDSLCRLMELEADGTGVCTMDLIPQVRQFRLCTAGEPADGQRPPTMPVPEPVPLD